MLQEAYIDPGLVKALRAAWCKETAYPPCREVYDQKHPSWGNCFVSALVIWAVQGGELLIGTVDMPSERGLWHFRNLVPAGRFGEVQVDATWEQFEDGSEFHRVTPLMRDNFKEMMVEAIWNDDTLLPRLTLLIGRMRDEGYEVGRTPQDILDELHETYRYLLRDSSLNALLRGPAPNF